MQTHIALGDLSIEVVKKNIKNIHLSVYPPLGRVRIAAPLYMELETIRLFVISKLDWIKREQRKILDQVREAPHEFLERESHYVWGKRYLLRVQEHDAAPALELQHSHLLLRWRPDTPEARKEELLNGWYRELIKAEIPGLLQKWQPLMGVQAARVFVQHMKTKWGSCNPAAAYIRLNSELAKKPPECLEYIVVHELAHLIEPTHNTRFVRLMDQFLPNWKHVRQELNRLPVRHEDWDY
ncbi:SprT family zinc-dependent metalloprotease [Massilia sp. W12]|uniref:M48 family metallopeptidase n=1 Tax=Massilia sp. W12 TaxID=3126507 RepID=UPI0030CD3871